MGLKDDMGCVKCDVIQLTCIPSLRVWCVRDLDVQHAWQGRFGGREGMLGRAVQQQHLQQPKPPKQKKQKEVQDTPAKPWRPLNEQEVLDGVRQAWKTRSMLFTPSARRMR